MSSNAFRKMSVDRYTGIFEDLSNYGCKCLKVNVLEYLQTDAPTMPAHRCIHMPTDRCTQRSQDWWTQKSLDNCPQKSECRRSLISDGHKCVQTDSLKWRDKEVCIQIFGDGLTQMLAVDICRQIYWYGCRQINANVYRQKNLIVCRDKSNCIFFYGAPAFC